MSWTLHLGDCLGPEGLATLPDKSVDHVITDPPYSRDLYLKFRTNAGARGHKVGGNTERRAYESRAHLELANQAIGAVDDVAEGAARQILRIARRWMLIFHDAESGHVWRQFLGDAHVRCGAWVKTNPVPQISGDRPGQGFESLEIAHAAGAKRWNGGGRSAVYVEGALQGNWNERAGNVHPCPKPLALMEALVSDFTDPGDTILDPFAGSGTTGVAAIRLGRNFIGWEKDPKYHAAAMKRLSAAREQLSLLGPRTKAKQEPLL